MARKSLAFLAPLPLLLLGGLPPAPVAASSELPWIPLFDGKTLNGWIQRGGAARYEVRDGAIVGTTVPNTKNSFLCTERRFGDFVLELEFKVDPELNSGVQVRGQSDPNYQDGRVHGYQVEIDPDTKRGRLWTGGIYDEGRRGWLADLAGNEAARQAFRPREWNRMRVEAMGESLKTWLNGVPGADVVDSMDLEGFIGLQVHQVGKRDTPFHVSWRDIRIQDHGRRAWLPLFAGDDLRGFRAEGGGRWTVEAGTLVGATDRSDSRPGLLFAETPLADATVRLEYRVTGGDSSLLVHARPDAPPGGQGPQVKIGPANGTGSRPPDAWSQMTVSSRAGHLVVHVNGIRTATLDADGGPREGRLGLELPGGADARLEVRRFERLSESIPPPVPGFPVGRCVRVLGITSPEDARTVGFEYLELALQDLLPLSDAQFEETVGRLRGLGIPSISGYGFLPADLAIVGPQVDVARVDDHLRQGLDRAARLGLQMVVLGNLNGASRRAPDGFPGEGARRQLVDFGRRAAREAKKRGLVVLIEPLPRSATNTVNTVAEALDLVRAVNDPGFQILVDYSFMVMGKEDLVILHEAGPHIRQVEISNPNGRVYPRSADESDYASFFRALGEGGYRGGFSVHGKPDIFFSDAPRAIALLRRLAGEIAAQSGGRTPPASK